MYQRILVPVDGSELSDRAITASIDLARQLGASITGFIAEPISSLPERPRQASSVLRDAEEYDTITADRAHEVLDRFAACAKAAGVPFEGHHAQVPRIDKAIIDAAESRGCDLIVMVTHGRGAFGEFLFGSQTKAVLAASRLPLLVLH
jgi:nucleotide-binding universal stress UspA family protein